VQFTDKETGKTHSLFQTKELSADLAKHYERLRCSHEKSEIRQRTVGGGTIQIRNQCLACGRAIGNAVKRDTIKNKLLDFDETIAPAFEARLQTELNEIYKKHLALQLRGKASFQTDYNNYMASQAWADKRRKVIERSGGVCEGCRERNADDVHHLTYIHFRNEFLFELVALCRACHDRIHEDKRETIGDELSDDFEPPCAACQFQDDTNDMPWCGKFDVSAKDAMAEGGECGPRQRELVPLK
jgi:hypothetical protein